MGKSLTWVARDSEGLTAFTAKPEKYFLNPYDQDDFIWVSTNCDKPISLNPELYPEITIENSPQKTTI